MRSASTRHAFVPRLWASRQIAFLVDELRQQGGDLGAPFGTVQRDPFADPRLRELRDEILRLSTRFGVLGEYTAFLAREGSRLDDWNALSLACQSSLKGRAVVTRSGKAAVNQGENLWKQKAQLYANPRNLYLDQDRNVVTLSMIQQVCDRGFFKRGNRWVDGNSVVNQTITPHQTITLASPAYFALARKLEAEGRCGVLSMAGEILVEVDGKNVLVTNPIAAPASPGKGTPKAQTEKQTTPKKQKKEIR